MPDYSKSKIYKLESLSSGLLYIGSTCQTLSQRFSEHFRDLRRYKNGKRDYVSSFKVIEYEDCKIYLVEDYPCDRKEQLLAREGEWIRKIDCVNKVIPGRTGKQYYLDNAEKINKRINKYKQNNIDKVKILNKKWYKINADRINTPNNCECGGKYTTGNISKHLNTNRHQLFLEQSPSLHQTNQQISDQVLAHLNSF